MNNGQNYISILSPTKISPKDNPLKVVGTLAQHFLWWNVLLASHHHTALIESLCLTFKGDSPRTTELMITETQTKPGLNLVHEDSQC